MELGVSGSRVANLLINLVALVSGVTNLLINSVVLGAGLPINSLIKRYREGELSIFDFF